MKLIPRTPTGAMLWEIWGRYKVSYFWQAAGLVASLFLVHWKGHSDSEIFMALLRLVTVGCFVAAYLQLLACHGYIEADAVKVKAGYPNRLLLKPLSTAWLVLVPMIFGALAVISVLAIWLCFIFRPLGMMQSLSMAWICAVAVSFFWWTQAAAWSFPAMKLRSPAVIGTGIVHLLLGFMPAMSTNIPLPGQWGILVAVLLSAVPFAWIGLGLMRQGRWEGSIGLAALWGRLAVPSASMRRDRFGSAFRAQFWLEWRTQGLLLPCISGGIQLVMWLLFFVAFKWGGVSNLPPLPAILAVMLSIPLVLSGAVSSALAKFDQLAPSDDLPVYITVRPMTNGSFVLIKMAVALAASAVTWAITIALSVLCLVCSGRASVAAIMPAATGGTLVALVLFLLTWKNLVDGLWTGLSGRKWITALSGAWRGVCGMGLFGVIVAARLDEDFKIALLRWLTPILIACLTGKLFVSVAAFVCGLRRNVLTRPAVGWIAGGWLAGSLFLAGYASLVCYALNRWDVWHWTMLAAFLILPLADLALAPVALAWNRHR